MDTPLYNFRLSTPRGQRTMESFHFHKMGYIVEQLFLRIVHQSVQEYCAVDLSLSQSFLTHISHLNIQNRTVTNKHLKFPEFVSYKVDMFCVYDHFFEESQHSHGTNINACMGAKQWFCHYPDKQYTNVFHHLVAH